MKSRAASRPLKTRIAFAMGRNLLNGLTRFIYLTSKVKWVNWDRVEVALASGRPIILVLWHDGIFGALLGRYSVRFPLIGTMISRSRDGDVITELGRDLGMAPIRASSSRGGAVGMMQFKGWLLSDEGEGHSRIALHLLDGPRGPRHKSKPGALWIAREAEAIILPISIGMARRWVARKSWDRQRIALPFGRIAIVVGEPIDLRETESRDGSEFTTSDLDAAMSANAQTDRLCARDEGPE